VFRFRVSLNFTNKRWKKEKKEKKSNEEKKKKVYLQTKYKEEGWSKEEEDKSLFTNKKQDKIWSYKEEKRIKKFAQHHQAFVWVSECVGFLCISNSIFYLLRFCCNLGGAILFCVSNFYLSFEWRLEVLEGKSIVSIIGWLGG
jgi:hypothetical protein